MFAVGATELPAKGAASGGRSPGKAKVKVTGKAGASHQSKTIPQKKEGGQTTRNQEKEGQRNFLDLEKYNQRTTSIYNRLRNHSLKIVVICPTSK